MEGVRIYEDAELNAALSTTNTPSSPDAIKKVSDVYGYLIRLV